jgi:RNA polymerase sigma-70 factor (ECF subfamily)
VPVGVATREADTTTKRTSPAGKPRLAAVSSPAPCTDPAAFTAIVKEHDRALRSLAFRLLGNEHDMDDALQDAYEKAFRALPGFRGHAAVGTWLYRIVYTTCIDHLRRRRRVQPVEDVAEAQTAPTDDPGDVIGRRQAVAAALAALSPEHRAVVLLVDHQGLDYGEAASILGVPLGTVGSRLSVARAAVREALGPALFREEGP